MISLSIIIVNWNTCELLKDCLASIRENLKSASEIEVIVVDNASADGSALMVQNDFPEVTLIANADNVGFVQANNQAARIARGRYLLLLNSDTKLLDGGALDVVDYLDSNPGVGIVTGRMLYEDRSFQSSYFRFPTIASGIIAHTFRRVFTFKQPFHRYFNYADLSPDETHEVDWACGAYLYLRRDVLDEGRVFNEALFMYYEDTLLCKRSWKLGLKVIYLPKAPIVHYHNKSAKQILAKAALYSFQSSVIYYEYTYGKKAVSFYRFIVHSMWRVFCAVFSLIPGKKFQDKSVFFRYLVREDR